MNKKTISKASKSKDFDSAQKFNAKRISGIMKKYKEVFKDLENYDKTHELPFHRKRIDITLSVRTINKLREESKRTGKPVSHIIEECIN